MRTALNALVTAATLVVATGNCFGGGLLDDFVARAIVGNSAVDARPKFPAVPESGYIPYAEGDVAALPDQSCYWTRTPLYDANRNVIGWRGRPMAVCPQSKVSADLSAR
jgi:hypothetical protein